MVRAQSLGFMNIHRLETIIQAKETDAPSLSLPAANSFLALQ
jgi:hypothetical protein